LNIAWGITRWIALGSEVGFSTIAYILPYTMGSVMILPPWS